MAKKNSSSPRSQALAISRQFRGSEALVLWHAYELAPPDERKIKKQENKNPFRFNVEKES
jgi:hypothetical protein